MKITDYIKIEEIKGLLVHQLRALGLLELNQSISEKDLDTMITAMSGLNKELKKMEKQEDQIDYLVAYIVGLWGRLIIDFGADIEAL